MKEYVTLSLSDVRFTPMTVHFSRPSSIWNTGAWTLQDYVEHGWSVLAASVLRNSLDDGYSESPQYEFILERTIPIS